MLKGHHGEGLHPLRVVGEGIEKKQDDFAAEVAAQVAAAKGQPDPVLDQGARFCNHRRRPNACPCPLSP